MVGEAALAYAVTTAQLTLLCIVCGTVIHAFVRPAAGAGWATRLAAGLAVATALVHAPLAFSTCQPIGRWLTGAILMWWAPMKVAALLLNRGPLVHTTSWIDTIITLSLPVVRDRRGVVVARPARGRCGGAWSHLRLLATKGAVLAALLGAYFALPIVADTPVLRHASYAAMVYLFASLWMDLGGAVAEGTLGVRLEPHFNAPYAAVSVREFWGRRWNLAAGSLLRSAVFEPVCDVFAGAPLVHPVVPVSITTAAVPAPPRRRPSQAVTAVALLAVFLVSAVAHEAMLALVAPTTRWLWFWFFTLQAPLMLAETALTPTSWASTLATSAAARFAARALTLAIVMGMAEVLFWPAAEGPGLDRRLLADCAATLSLPIAAGSPCPGN